MIYNWQVVIDSAPRPMPPEVSETLPPVAEGDETEEEKRKLTILKIALQSAI